MVRIGVEIGSGGSDSRLDGGGVAVGRTDVGVASRGEGGEG